MRVTRGFGDVSQAFARCVKPRDPAAAALVALEGRCLATPDAVTEDDERDALARSVGGYSFEEFRRNTFSIEEDGWLDVWCYDDDLVTLGSRSPRLGALRHAEDALAELRALFARRSPSAVRSLHLLLFGPVQPFEQFFDELHARERVSHLVLRREHDEPLAELSGVFPALSGLEANGADLPALLGEGNATLESLVVRTSKLEPLPFLTPASLPSLRHLALREPAVPKRALEQLLASDIVDGLATLEISSTNHAVDFPFDVLLDGRERLSHLRRVVIGGHLVPAKARRRFASWRELTMVSHDRRELLALDLERTGWPFGSR